MGSTVIALAPFAPYHTAFLLETADGILAGVHVPAVPAPVPEEVFAALHPAERDVAGAHRAYRQVQYVGGRLAVGLALHRLGLTPHPVLNDPHGAPTLPAGVVGSISHKRELAVAIARRGEGGLGVDLEDTARRRADIEAEVLCGDESAALAGLDEDERWLQMITRFSLKEALYKALHPLLRQRIGFRDVAVTPHSDGAASVELRFPAGAACSVEARHQRLDRWVLSMVSVRLITPPSSPA
jgi:enterobactin synthetase component D